MRNGRPERSGRPSSWWAPRTWRGAHTESGSWLPLLLLRLEPGLERLRDAGAALEEVGAGVVVERLGADARGDAAGQVLVAATRGRGGVGRQPAGRRRRNAA